METMLQKLLAVVTVDDVKEMKRLGLGDEAAKLLDLIEGLSLKWLASERDGKSWAEVYLRLCDLRAVLNEK